MTGQQSSVDPIRKLAAFLKAITADRPVERVHAGIMDEIANPRWQHAVGGLKAAKQTYASATDFSKHWKAMADGAAVPRWERLVQPVAITFSTDDAVAATLVAAAALHAAALEAKAAEQPPAASDKAGSAQAAKPAADPEAVPGATVYNYAADGGTVYSVVGGDLTINPRHRQ
ncbi:hypothetical protein Cs7R123_49110 [Catellatospora sp. TT07R-123]|uniref:hypothetical protein n=1 Tax=Catellatospora sp. TT07R-123 TaxID=2733863 RepID=UPI001B268789|nr:hypothetical protein [Catellatospora sp. TT07R-123]GHJ47569.1 hypothetical protein Cs7R123_49110 [Catellatospora sp. TT07R-123]